MPTRAAHHRAPPPPPRHTTPTHASATHATTHTTPAALVDRSHEATTTPHLDGFDHTPRTPYGVRLGGDEHLAVGASPVPTAPPDLRARDVPTAPEHSPTPRADARPAFMERIASSFPLFDTFPGVRTFPTGSGGTIGTHDGTTEAAREAGRADARLDEHGRSSPSLPPPTLPDRAREDALHSVDEAIERARFEASPEGTAAATATSH